MVEDETSRAFEKAVVLLEAGQVDDAFDQEAAGLLLQLIQNVAAPLLATIPGHQRVQHDGSVRMRADPVVRKDLVGQLDRIAARKNPGVDAALLEGRGQVVELFPGPRSRALRVLVGSRRLE